MTITLNPAIVTARSEEAAARFFAQIFGVNLDGLGDDASFESYHYAFQPTKRNRRVALAFAVAVIAAASAATLALGQSGAGIQGKRTVVAQSRFIVTDPVAQAELVQLVIDFEPGAWTSLHTHGGQAINLVIEGEITLRHGGMDRLYKAGQSWTDSTSEVHAAGNIGPGKGHLLTNFLLPKGCAANHSGAGVSIRTRGHVRSEVPGAASSRRSRDRPAGGRPFSRLARAATYNGFAAGVVLTVRSPTRLVRTGSRTNLVMPGCASWHSLHGRKHCAQAGARFQ